jgi:YARHG domain
MSFPPEPSQVLPSAKPSLRTILLFVVLFSAIPRLPAPIQETAESPTPTPEPRPPQELSSPFQPSPANTRSPNPPLGSNSSVTAWPGEEFPETRLRRLKAEEIAAWNTEKVRYAINELYARGGYDFRVPEVKQVFLRLSWYRERLVNGRTQDEAYAHLSALERSNLELLQAIRRGK